MYKNNEKSRHRKLIIGICVFTWVFFADILQSYPVLFTVFLTLVVANAFLLSRHLLYKVYAHRWQRVYGLWKDICKEEGLYELGDHYQNYLVDEEDFVSQYFAFDQLDVLKREHMMGALIRIEATINYLERRECEREDEDA